MLEPKRVNESVKNFVQLRLVRPIEEFLAQEVSGGLFLIAATVAALVWANSSASATYSNFWHIRIGTSQEYGGIGATLHFVVNDVLMAVFFFVVGMEIKREMLVGELAKPRQAALPILAAVGGAVLPALIFAGFNASGPGKSAWGVPMATDIAFAVGVMALLGKRVPLGVKVFLMALAIADDLMAVLVIAFFYTSQILWPALAVAVLCLLLLTIVNRLGTRSLLLYVVLGGFLWYFTLRSGVHSTVAGVALAFAIPARREDDLLYRLVHRLHPWVTYFIMPVFALANAGLTLRADLTQAIFDPIVAGIWIGLLIGKPLGITFASWMAVKLGWACLPANVRWRDLHAASWLGGIGFTMSLFIANLALHTDALLNLAKIGIFGGSLTAGLVGSALLMRGRAPQEEERPSEECESHLEPATKIEV